MLTVERNITVADVRIHIASQHGLIEKLVTIPLCESECGRVRSRLNQFPELYREGKIVCAEVQRFRLIHFSMPILQFIAEAEELSGKTL